MIKLKAIIVAIRGVISYFLHKEVYPTTKNNKATGKEENA